MTRLPRVTSREVLRRLKRAGFFVHVVAGGHYILKSGDGKRRVTVQYHSKDLKPKTLKSILNQAGISVDEFLEF